MTRSRGRQGRREGRSKLRRRLEYRLQKRVVPVKAAEDRPRSPRRGPARGAQCPHERRSGARGEALWAPVGDRAHGRSCSGAFAGDDAATQRWAFEIDTMGAVDDAVENGVGQGGITEYL